MVIAAGDQSSACRGTQGCRVELRIAQPHGRDAIKGRCGDNPVEGARNAVPGIVSHDQQDVRRALWGHNLRGPIWLRVLGFQPDLTAEWVRRGWQIMAINGGGRAGGTWDASRFLRISNRRQRRSYEKAYG